MKNTPWQASNQDGAKYVGIIEFQDNKGEWHNFEILATNERLIFGGTCNIGFLESGYIGCEGYEFLDEALGEMLADLEVYYNNGPQHVSYIVCNDRM